MTAPEYATCPCGCGTRQDAGLLSASCTDRLEQLLAEVPALVTELAVTASKQARVGAGGGGAGLARERSPISWGAVEAADNLANVLTTWARDVGWNFGPVGITPAAVTAAAAACLRHHIDTIRRHPAVAELVDEIGDAISQARRAIDRPADKVYLGKCLVPTTAPGTHADGSAVTDCQEDVWARQNATQAVCRACGITHDVHERRAWLLLQAADMLTTAKEASRYIGEVGHIKVTEASIRGLIHRQRIAYRAGTTTFRLGDLLDVLTDMRTKETAA